MPAAWLHIQGVKPPATHDISRLLLSLRAFSIFAVQCRYDDEPEHLSLDRTVWCNQAGTHTLSMRRTSRRSPQRARPRKGCASRPTAGDETPRALASVSAAAGP